MNWIIGMAKVDQSAGRVLAIADESEQKRLVCLIAPDGNVDDQDMKHAKLLASAPALLALVKEVEYHLRVTSSVFDTPSIELMNKAKAAIAKAEGVNVAAANTLNKKKDGIN